MTTDALTDPTRYTMRNIAIELRSDVLEETQLAAKDDGLSVSQYIERQLNLAKAYLEERRAEREIYEAELKRYRAMSQQPTSFLIEGE